MKMVYLFNHYEVFENQHIGIRKKMNMQIKAFRQMGYEVFYLIFDENKVLIENVSESEKKLFYFLSIGDLYSFILDTIAELKPEFVYMRYRMIYTPNLYQFYFNLNKISENNICEFYTYPYDTEFQDDDYDMLMDRYYAKNLSRVFKYSSNYNGYKEILGIPSVSISNGIDLDSIPIAPMPQGNSFNMISVSTMYAWHGYDRVLEGMHLYYENGGKENVIFYLIGDGQERDRYEEIVEHYKLEEHVMFLGKIVDQNKLNDMFSNVHVAIGSVGMHRLNLKNVSPIKSAEYCARGIPFVINYNDISFSEETEYIHKVSYDETPLNIEKIIDFAKRQRNCDVSSKMRDFAYKELSWYSQMRKILETFGLRSFGL